MIVYKKTFKNIKTLNIDFPVEDQYYVNENEAIVVDGITRDPIGISDFSSVSIDEKFEKYPRPSGAELIAKTIADVFSNTKGSLKKRLIKCNNEVKKLNDKYIKNCDYLEKDYYGAVCSCAKIKNSYLHYAFICDCGVIVYSKDGVVKFQTPDEKKLYCDPFFNHKKMNELFAEARKIIRSEYRNKPDKIINGKCVSYGALTGEKSAISFIRNGKIKLEKYDTIIVYSDGFANFLHLSDFIKTVINFDEEKFEENVIKYSFKDPSVYGLEKTLIILKK